MKASFAAAAAAAALAVCTPASAEIYGSIGGGFQSIDFDSVGGATATVGALTGRVGWKSARWFGVEADATYGVGSDRAHETLPVKVKLQGAAFAYGVAFLPANERFDFIARLGYGRQQAEVSGPGVKEDTGDDAFAYGAGAQLKVSDKNRLRFDYTRIDVEDAPIDSVTFSYVRSF